MRQLLLISLVHQSAGFTHRLVYGGLMLQEVWPYKRRVEQQCTINSRHLAKYQERLQQQRTFNGLLHTADA